MAHRVETTLAAPADDILEAIAHGFRAMADVKGKLAELYLNRMLEKLKREAKITDFVWNDKDSASDFEVLVSSRKIIIECKNVRSNKKLGGDGWATVELQKTRSGVDASGKKTRGYSRDHFDIIGVCLFNQLGRWEYRFRLSSDLAVRSDSPGTLVVMQRVELKGASAWTENLEELIARVAAQKQPTSGRRRRNARN